MDRPPLRALLPMALDRFWDWFYSRRIRPLLEGLPAILVGVAALVIVVYGRYGPDDELVTRYKRAVGSALKEKDHAAADVYLRKLESLAPRDDQTLYSRALLTAQQGDRPAAVEVMQRLAPEDDLGHGPAHFWLAKNLMGRNDTWTGDQLSRLIHHLESALASDPSLEEARIVLARVHAAQGQYDDALKHLNAVVDRRPSLRLMMARIYSVQGAVWRATSELERATKHFQRQVESDERDARSRVLWAKSVWLQDKFSEATAILRDGLAKTGDDRLSQALADLYVAQFDRLLDSDDQDLAVRLALLQRALHYRPDHSAALARLANLACESGEEAESARLALKRILAEGKATTTVHLILGTRAASDGNLEMAAVHLEQARGLNPRAPVVLNNLAWVLANSPQPQLERALEVSNAAVRLLPSHPQIRETRGQILARMQRPQEALLDLEFALQKLPPRPKLHQALAEVYGQLGEPELAAEHRRRAEAIKDDS